jgi:hypothetical protein
MSFLGDANIKLPEIGDRCGEGAWEAVKRVEVSAVYA